MRMHVYRILFRLRGKEYRTIALAKTGQGAKASVEALAPGVVILAVEPLGACEDWSEAEFARLVMETQDRNEHVPSRAACVVPQTAYVC
jgi:hypothetical protein